MSGAAPLPVGIVQHVEWEGPGLLAGVLTAAGLATRTLWMVDGEAAPEPESLAGLVVLGGPMRATDVERYPSLAAEVDLLRAAVAVDLPVLGICLGHQLLGLALGGRLLTGRAPEVGVGPVSLATGSALGPEGESVDVVHWHRDQVSLPPGAQLLASSDACDNQAFRRGTAWGLQFHVEVDRPMLRRWLGHPHMRHDVPAGARVLEDFDRAQVGLARLADAALGQLTRHAARCARTKGSS
ncbi:gamma-glutamyl-gamma-aminobutyrate hydrolase family protein [Nocardioides sp. 503]|uniref:type 1 glutamine amidotransferase n=1 Tax=Nocardioides sp. 503 TaxID=2508326 RepID=UPI00106FE0FB|nr:gamma-glutamyl-gamma-aminobutyrate hydrolase family protein [Nocardioides sp. 503]